MSDKLKCYSCKFLHLKGSGYSDWTWTSTWFVCTRNRFEETHEEPEGEDIGIIEKASKDCPFYVNGEPLETSPDGGINGGDSELAKSLGYEVQP